MAWTAYDLTLDVSENEVIQTNLTSKEHLHVNFVGVQCAEKNLEGWSSWIKAVDFSQIFFFFDCATACNHEQ